MEKIADKIPDLERLRKLIDCFNDSVLLISRNGSTPDFSIVEVNDSAVFLLEYTGEEFKNLHLSKIFDEETYLSFIKTNNITLPVEGVCCSKKGSQIPVEYYIKPILSEENLFLLTISDITLRKKHEDQLSRYIQELHENKDLMERNGYELVLLNVKLEESEEQLKALNASKDKFFSIIAHDLKSPFTSFMGLTELIAEDFESFEQEEIKTLIAELNKNAKNVYSLLENLLNWSRMQTGRMEHQPEELKPFELVNKTYNLFEQMASQKKINIIHAVDTDSNIYADKNMIETVLRNLVSNAIKFTPPEGTIIIKASDKGEELVEFTVIDSGVGMDDYALSKLFRIDVHHTTLGTNKEKGTGLGLILCKELVEKNGGSISVESKQGSGTKFIFVLPVSKN